MSEVISYEPHRPAVIEGFSGEKYFTPDDLELLKAAAGCEDWKGTQFEDNVLNIRASIESRIFHADTVKRKFALETLGFNEQTGQIARIPQELVTGIAEVSPETNDPELWRFIKLKGGAFRFGPIERGSLESIQTEIGEPSFLIDDRDEDAITETIGLIHSHSNLTFVGEELRKRGVIWFRLPKEAPEYSSVPTLGDLIGNIIYPEIILGVVVAGDRSATLIIRPGLFLDHFKAYPKISPAEWEALLGRCTELMPGYLEEEWKFAKEFADEVGLKLFRGKITEDNQLVLNK